MKPIRKDEIEYLSNYIDKKFKSRRSALESEREFEVDNNDMVIGFASKGCF